ncbi:MAG: EAL domain-containing protein [Betaproteobacteria bacterium]|nr:EAL domain-containing protein [Betaproteobacteria bacterium]
MATRPPSPDMPADLPEAQMLALAVDGAEDGFWYWNLQTGDSWFSDRWYTELGYQPGELKPTLTSWRAMIHPGDRLRVDEQVQRYLSREITRYDVDFRCKTKTGTYKWFRSRGQARWDSAGKAVCIAGAISDISRRRAAEEKVRLLAYYDAVTHLPNRVELEQRAQRAIELAEARQSKLAVMFIDLDRFKHINDSLGHMVGDELLRTIGLRFRDVVQTLGTVARQGGDEFIVLLEGLGTRADAQDVAGALLRALDAPCALGPHSIHVSASIGISLFPDDGRDVPTLLRHADTAMFAAKDGGRHRVCFFTEQMSVAAQRRLALEQRLRVALEHNEFSVHYQPLVNLATEQVVGSEALLRWRHAELGDVSPGEFIPVAESTGTILDIGRWTLLQACRQTRQWQMRTDSLLSVSVNMSARQVFQGEMVRTVSDCLRESGLPAESLVLELTESTLLHNPEEAQQVLGQLRKLGVRLCIDDFGTGFSSLAYLRRYAFDIVKIDQSFVQELDRDVNNQAIVAAVIAMCRKLGVAVVAEGVETFEQLRALKQQGCTLAQGYLMGKPMQALDFGIVIAAGDRPRAPAHPAAGTATSP